MDVVQAKLATSTGPEGTAFGETNWWVISKAGQPNAAGAGAARESLCQIYWWPVFLYLRRFGYSFEDSQDLTQGFFARLLEKNYVQGAAREKGKFRSFLLLLLKRYLSDQQDRAGRQKRGGGQEPISLDSGDTDFRRRLEPADALTPEKAFERNWATALLNLALERLEQEILATGKSLEFAELRPLIICESQETCAAVAQRLSWSEANVKVTVHRLRRRLGDLLRAEIAKTATTPDEVEAEIHELFSAFN